MKKNNCQLISHIAFGLVTYIPIALILLVTLLFYQLQKFVSLFFVSAVIISPFVGWFFEIPALILSIYCFKQCPKYKKLI